MDWKDSFVNILSDNSVTLLTLKDNETREFSLRPTARVTGGGGFGFLSKMEKTQRSNQLILAGESHRPRARTVGRRLTWQARLL
jgi:hypothetical protein